MSTVGLLAVRATDGRVDDALRGYRDVIDYFARTGNFAGLPRNTCRSRTAVLEVARQAIARNLG